MGKKVWFVWSLLFVCSYGAEGLHLETFWIWIALFVLGLIGIVILFVSSSQIRKTEQMYRKMFEKQQELEKGQAELLSTMSENIHHMVQQALKKEKGGEKPPFCEIQDSNALVCTAGKSDDIEEKLLTVTSDLITFLRLKAGKTKIVNEKFNVNNVLNEISGYICHKYQGKQVDLIFDIHHNVPRLLVGDSLHIGYVINSIVEYMISRLDRGELKLEISTYNTYDEKIELEFLFSDTGEGMDEAVLESLFEPYYDTEKGVYYGLGLFVSKRLTEMMQGELIVQSQKGKGSSFALTLPLKIFDRSNKRRYHLPEKALTSKKVFIVDENYHAALAIKKTFSYFKHEVKVLSRELFEKEIPDLMSYDIVVLHHRLFTPKVTAYLEQVKSKKTVKIVALHSLLEREDNAVHSDITDTSLYTPLNQERVFEMIVKLYPVGRKKTIQKKKENKVQPIQVCKSHIPETKDITRYSFSTFKGKQVLIVEDNIINQKVLSSLLEPAGVIVSLAGDGQEAVEMIQEEFAHFDLVLMDINMPVLDGYAATEIIRRDAHYDTLPIVAFTALVLESEIEKMFESGVNAFLSKPLNIGKLYTALSMFLPQGVGITDSRTDTPPAKEKSVSRKLDTVQGIKHANNNKILYMELLSEFLSVYGTSNTLFEKLVHEHRYEQIKMLCIDMRGLSGTIGAHDMQVLVNMVFQAILYKKQHTLVDFIGQYNQEMAVLRTEIETYLSLNDYVGEPKVSQR